MGLRNRIDEPNCFYFLTTTVVEFLPVFTTEARCSIILDNLVFYRKKYDFKLIAYVIMPEHIHMVLKPHIGTKIAEIMRDFKKYTSVQIRQLLEKEGDTECLSVFMRNANLVKKARRVNHKETKPHSRAVRSSDLTGYKVWMDRYDELAVYSPDVLLTKINYIHENPVRKGLVRRPEDWLYSSYRNYYFCDESLLSIDREDFLSGLRT
jgi:REP element-mobilizing transposase RayT